MNNNENRLNHVISEIINPSQLVLQEQQENRE